MERRTGLRSAPRPCGPRVLELEGAPEPAELLGRFGPERRPALLDSAGGRPRRFSLLALDPLRTVREEDLLRHGALPALRELHGSLCLAGGDPVPGPFAGGFVGALAYDLGVAGEPLDLPPEPWGFPLVVGGLYTDFVVRDERAGRTWLVVGEVASDGRPPAAERRERLLAELAAPAVPAPPPRSAGPLERRVPRERHLERIEQARERIAEGEVYQVNLAHRMTRAMVGRPEEIYRSLRAANPAPYMAYLAWDEPRGGGALLSSSPELLLEWTPRLARTRPIKGTAPRGADAASDRASARALLASEKDRAELGMIVDLERNDLGRIARPGSVRVCRFPELESYASVHHLAASVTARPLPGTDAWEAIAALFPGGSISGAPKLRSLEVIAELEQEGRGFFSGSLGYVDLRGRAQLNILIRTLLWRSRPDLTDPLAGEISFRVGGGITWSSVAEEEDAETLAKAQALARATEESR